MFYKVEYNENSCAALWNIELFLLHIIGLKSVKKAFDDDKYQRAWIQEIVIIIVNITVFLVGIYSCSVTLGIVGYEDISVAAETVALILSTTMCMLKGVVLTLSHRQLFDVLRELHILWKEAKTRKNLGLRIGEIINSSKPVRYWYASAAMSVGLSYMLRPYFKLLVHFMKNNNSTFDYSTTSYAVEYPFPHNSFLTYTFCIIFEQWESYWGCLYSASCDTIFIQLSTHICIHLLVLSSDYSMEFPNDENKYAYYNTELVISLTKRHRHILELCNQVERLFNPIIFCTILFNGLDLCCCIFAEISQGQWPKFARSVAHAITLMIQIVIYCDYAHRVTEMTKMIAMSIYNSPWIDSDKNVQKLLMISMMRANEEYKFSAYGILVLDREQMTRIFKTTGSYVTLLRSFS
ncbi:hypothetical protein KQX54_014770 [Cotesia glomerata]|uniref:Odorant receptor n=1 Tax=Cotesia glomerata TaxID=32391 RepID=A0AAV7IS69_COTGL|nr:hypothetical protein KQX54_014770 [Cotesia glomerata]